jgi:hypothetical protein
MSKVTTDRHVNRWYPLIDHQVQMDLIQAVSTGVRFPVVPAGRRSGKTERFKRFLVKQALINPGSILFAAAPTYNQVKKIYWDDLKLLSFCYTAFESDLKIRYRNGSEIHLIGLDKPERMEGIPWDGGGVDEIADIKKDAWALNILPSLNTVNPLKLHHRAWCWLLGVPNGLNHYYDMAQYAQVSGDKEWGYYHWKSDEILPKDVIESVKKTMSIKQYKQEFEASFETVTGRIYEDYGVLNSTSETIGSNETLHWCHDQNYSPMSSAVCVIRDDGVYILDEIVLQSAVSRQSAEEFVERYKEHSNKRVAIYGDPSGRIGEKHGHASDYIEIEKVLKSNGWTFERRVARSHPPIKDRQNSLRAQILSAAGERSLFVNPGKAPYSHKGLSTVQVKEGSTYMEEETEYQHITTAIGYMIHYLYPQGTINGSAAYIKRY